jgi:hypothetical protein
MTKKPTLAVAVAVAVAASAAAAAVVCVCVCVCVYVCVCMLHRQVRKLEFLMAAAKQEQHDSVIT